MVIAVLEAHCGVRLGTHDVYLNVAGGLRIQRAGRRSCGGSGARLVAGRRTASGRCSLFRRGIAVGRDPPRWRKRRARLKEAAKLGFQRAFLPDPGRSDAHRRMRG